MVGNRYGKVEVTKTVTDGTNTFAEIKATGGASEVVNVWLSTEEVSKLIWGLQKVLLDDMKFNHQKLTKEDFPTHLAPKPMVSSQWHDKKK